jgi:hypothetical protein
VAALVSTALEAAGISAVLSGGAVVSIYTHNEYESADLDPRESALRRVPARTARHWRRDDSRDGSRLAAYFH